MLLRGGRASDKLVLQDGVRIPLGRHEDKITDFEGEFWSEEGDHMMEPGSFIGDILGVKLGLHLSESRLWVHRPEGWALDCHSQMVGSAGGGCAGGSGWMRGCYSPWVAAVLLCQGHQ